MNFKHQNRSQCLVCSLIYGLCLLFISCEKVNLDPRDFFEVELAPVTLVSPGKVVLSGNLANIGESIIEDHGFVWSTTTNNPSLTEREGIISLGTKNTEQTFQDTVDIFDPKAENIFVKAFARLGERIQYSERIERFDFRNLKVIHFSNSPNKRVSNNSLFLEGAITGLASYNKPRIDSLGFVIALREEWINTENEVFVSQGSTTSDLVYFDTILSLPFNTNIFSTSVAYSEGKRFQSDSILVSRIEDGWRRVDSPDALPSISAGGVWTTDQGIFFGLGCDQFPCDSDNIVEEIWNLDPETGKVTLFDKLENFVDRREEFVYFSYANKLYFGLGKSGNEYLKDFYVYDPSTKSCMNLPDFENSRAGAIAVVVDNFMYVGTGYRQLGDNTFVYYEDLYRYDLSMGQLGEWESFPSAPVRIENCTKLLDNNNTRHGAIAFELEGDLYLGFGKKDNFSELSDLYVFRSPATNALTGEWEYLGCNDLPLVFGSVVNIGGRIFLGTGSVSDILAIEEMSTQWWEFIPGSNKFVERTEFQGEARWKSQIFEYEGKGYLLGGKKETTSEVTGSKIDVFFSELWQYNPPEN